MQTRVKQYWALVDRMRSRPTRRGKSLTQFIKDNKTEIDNAILRVCNNCQLNDRERRLWILNDEDLYSWAKSEEVKI
jgi:hypothetical protein